MPDWGLLDPLASVGGSAVDDDAVLAALVEAESALTAAWLDLGFAPDWVSELEFDATALDLSAIAKGNRAGGNPIIPVVSLLRTQAEAAHEGAGDWVHRGATSQDILDTALMIVAAKAVSLTAASLEAVADSLATLADTHRHTVMVGRTLSQHAAPITFGVKVSSWLDGVDAARRSLASLTLPVQLAGAVGTGSAFDDLAGAPGTGARLRAAFAARLGRSHPGLSDPGRSWQAERSPIFTLSSSLATSIGVLGRIATDVLVLARTEVAELSEGSGGTSSAMPQKQNPTTAVLVRSAALQAPGLLATIQSSLLTDDERPTGTWHAEWLALRSLLRLAIESSEAAVVLVGSLAVDSERMLANLDASGGLAWAEHAQSQLTAEVGRASAAALVASAIKKVSPELPFGAALAAERDGRAIDLSPESLFATTDPIVDASIARAAIARAANTAARSAQ